MPKPETNVEPVKPLSPSPMWNEFGQKPRDPGSHWLKRLMRRLRKRDADSIAG